MRKKLQARLEEVRPVAFILFAGMSAFSVYFCMYAFRKPFTAGSFEGYEAFGVELKTALVTAQLIGYALSKFIGIKVCSEVLNANRGKMLVQLILAAHTALLLFAVLPENLKVVALFLNGIPLGMVWGLVVGTLEGRQCSDVLLACLACSFILASGVVKDVGRFLMSGLEISEWWMPFWTGLFFLPLFLLSTWLLSCLPPPNEGDIASRTLRKPMTSQERRNLIMRFPVGWFLLIAFYLMLTAVRDFRDNFGQEILNELGLGRVTGIFTMTETVVAFIVMLTMAGLNLITNNRRGFLAALGAMITGMLILLVGTLAFQGGAITGLTWMIMTGLGSYLAYVPFNTILFERLVAYTRISGTAVFAIYLSDAAGYSGAIALQVGKDLLAESTNRLSFFENVTIWGGCFGILACLLCFIAFKPEDEKPTHPRTAA